MEARKAGYWKEGWMDVAANPTNVQGTAKPPAGCRWQKE